jgi:hypothetical protein
MRKDQRAFVLSLALAGSVLASVATPASAAELTATDAGTYATVESYAAVDAFFKFNTTLPQVNAFFKI